MYGQGRPAKGQHQIIIYPAMLKRVKNAIKVLLGKSKAVSLEKKETPYYCPVCAQKNVHFNQMSFSFFRKWDKYELIHSVFLTETMNMEFYTCSNCGAGDRDRLYALYFNKVNEQRGNSTEILKILDIAPAKQLTQFLRTLKGYQVRTADLFMEGVDDKVDITHMDAYTDGSFDVFICSHVLEHIDNDIKAMAELYRVLKTGGWGIAMVPINLGLQEVYENVAVQTEADRWKHFGQDDHVRMYSKQGFVNRLASVGFTVQQLGIGFFGEETFVKNGIHPRSVLYIVNK
jgi:predicted SAM-dependent methyltransferase